MVKPTRVLITSMALGFGLFFLSAPMARAYYPTEHVTNGGFELAPIGTGWTVSPGDAGNIGTLGTTWHGGTQGVKLGYGHMNPIIGTTEVYQDLFSGPDFSVPTSPSTVTFSAWINISSDETALNTDTFFINLINPNNADESFCSFRVDAATATQNIWTTLTCDISAAKGKLVHVYTNLHTNNSGITYVNVDDISIAGNYPDFTSPTTTYSIAPPISASCPYSTIPKITLTGTDDTGGSGVSGTAYYWDAGPAVTYTAPIIPPKGSHTLYYYSTDAAGNVETLHSQAIQYGDTRALSVRLAELNQNIVVDTSLTNRLRGRILLQVQKKGEAWYLYPKNSRRYFLCRPVDAFTIMRRLGLGISNADLKKIPRYGTTDVGDPVLVKRLLGRILLQVEKNGEAWYVYPVNGKRNYMGRPADAFSLMRNLGLGITNANLNKILVGLLE